MTSTKSAEAVSPLRRRMIEDMSVRKFGDKTRHDYIRHVESFAKFLGRDRCSSQLREVATRPLLPQLQTLFGASGGFGPGPKNPNRRTPRSSGDRLQVGLAGNQEFFDLLCRPRWAEQVTLGLRTSL